MSIYAIVIGYTATPCCFPSPPQSVMIPLTEVNTMNIKETKDIILELRTKKGLSQDDLAGKVITIMGRDSDGALNEDYCKWCYADGTYTYSNMDDLIEVCVKNMVGEDFTENQAKAYMEELLPKLDYWKRYESLSDGGQFEAFKRQLIDEINALQIEGMPHIERLNALVGKYVNLEYRLPNGMNVKFLDDEKTYLGNQLECEFGGDRCFGVLANMDFILISTYEAEGINLELVLYKKR